MRYAPLLVLLAIPTTSFAARQPADQGQQPGFVLADGVTAVRGARVLSPTASALRRSTASRFASDAWTIVWDADTAIPVRIFGEGRSFPGSNSDANAALRAAEQVLSEELELLAPGSSAADFLLIYNREVNGVRMVNFAQHHRGVRIVDATIGFRFKADRLVVIASEAFPNIAVDDLSAPLPVLAAETATSWINSELGIRSTASTHGPTVILPMVHGPGSISYLAALPLSVHQADGIGEWTVYVGADGGVVGRLSTIHFAEGTINYNVPERWPGGTRVDLPAQFTNHVVDGIGQQSNGAGLVIFDGATASVTTGLTGALVTNQNQGGNSQTTLTVNDGASATWTGGDVDELLDAELAVYIHAGIATTEAQILNPGLAILAQPIPANVNRTDSECNAFAGATSINFFVASSPAPNLSCGNTGQLADVIYHEFGHYLHINTINENGGSFDSAFSEGLSDYYAATITNDSAMGRGFFLTEEPLRPIDGPGGDIFWPQAYWDNVDTHYTGVVFAGAMWDVRLALMAELGDVEGDALADRLFYGAVQRASSVDTAYIEVLTEDDDDGNLANGTPNQCAIDYGFGTHGFGPTRSILGEGLELHTRDGFVVSIAEKTPASGCPAPAIGSMELKWQLRSDPEAFNGTVPMELSSGQYTATIPQQDEGEVIQYQITVSYADGNTRRIPLNFSEPFYEFFNGEVEEVYCTDFETDPLAEGWQLDNFQLGTPAGGENNTDAPAAFSGNNVMGNQLAGNGAYSDSSTALLTSPAIDVDGRSNLRLQFRRWLTVDDGNFDQARISANGRQVYTNKAAAFLFAPELNLDHEWRFVDVDVSQALTTGTGTASVTFSLTAGPPFNNNPNPSRAGGWNIDDLCLVEFVASVCGDGEVSGN